MGVHSVLQVSLRRNLEIKLLTASKDVSLRRLRGFSAPVGARADVVGSVDELFDKLQTGNGKKAENIVIHDLSLAMSDDQLRKLNTLARVYRVGPVGSVGSANAVAGTHTEFQAECRLVDFFDSIILRRALPHIWGWPPAMQPENLLGWGHAVTNWQPHHGRELAEVAKSFHHSLALTGNGRRLIELLSHQSSTRLPLLNIEVGEATFGCDGAVVLMSLKCQYVGAGDINVAALAAEIRSYQLPLASLTYHGANRLEIMAVASGNPSLPVASSGTLLLLDRENEAAAPTTATLPRAV